MADDWADAEDHDALNDLVGCTIRAVRTGTEYENEWLEIETSRGRALRIRGQWTNDGTGALAFTIEEL